MVATGESVRHDLEATRRRAVQRERTLNNAKARGQELASLMGTPTTLWKTLDGMFRFAVEGWPMNGEALGSWAPEEKK